MATHKGLALQKRKDDAMTKIMTPSKTMTAGQIDKAVANYRALLEKHSEEFSAETVQMVLGQSELAGKQLAVFRCRVEAVSNFIVRTAKVNRSRSQREAIEATGRRQHTNREVVDVMPKAEADEVELVFFKPDLSNRNGFISDDDLEKEFELRGLKPADPVSVAAVDEVDPVFSDEKPHGTHWKDSNGNWCYAAFRRWDVRRKVYVGRHDHDWNDYWWFAGVPRK
jgi:hypothetical protein